MIEQLLVYGFCLAVGWYFRKTSGNQRRRAFNIALLMILAFGVIGLSAEIWMRGGAFPLTN